MLRMSTDDGKTWPDARIVFPYTTAYSDIAVLADGRIGVLFERDNHTKIDLAILPAITEKTNATARYPRSQNRNPHSRASYARSRGIKCPISNGEVQ